MTDLPFPCPQGRQAQKETPAPANGLRFNDVPTKDGSAPCAWKGKAGPAGNPASE